jgi:hypothetical protein
LFGEKLEVTQVFDWIILPPKLVEVARLREKMPAGKPADEVAITLFSSARIMQKVIFPVDAGGGGGGRDVTVTVALAVLELVPFVQVIL